MDRCLSEAALRRAASGRAWRTRLAGVGGLVLGLAAAALAQYPSPGLTIPPATGTTPGPTSLIGIGGVAPIGPTGIRLTFPARFQRGAVWLAGKQPVAGGFQTTFQFRISGIEGIVQASPFAYQTGGVGFAFLIQTYSVPVVGPLAGFLG